MNISDSQVKILQALFQQPLSDEELVKQTGLDEQKLFEELYQLRTQKMLIDKHQVISGGCTNCACSVSYKWRLTFSGRQEVSFAKDKDHE